ncbi:MAG: ABC transporter ATP-binding protein [Gammaproteobacteria bacterium]
MIRLRDLSFRYVEGGFELSVPELEISAGEQLAVVGPSGSGKTTLLNLIAGILSPERGDLVVMDQELNHLNDAQKRAFRLRRIGMVFQSFELLDYLSVVDNILLPLRIGGGKVETTDRQRATELARQMGIGDKLDRPIDQLSQGERQRAAVCRALLLRPPLILADEPTGNLDPANKGIVLSLLLEYATSNDATVVTVTHDQNLLSRFSRVIDFDALNQASVGSV